MTNKELNAAIKKLWNEHYHMSFQGTEEYFKWRDEVCKPEFRRLYHADTSMTSWTIDSIKKMLRLNLTIRAVELHIFGIDIKID